MVLPKWFRLIIKWARSFLKNWCYYDDCVGAWVNHTKKSILLYYIFYISFIQLFYCNCIWRFFPLFFHYFQLFFMVSIRTRIQKQEYLKFCVCMLVRAMINQIEYADKLLMISSKRSVGCLAFPHIRMIANEY